ncbi:hypothetical protein KCV03_g351, partial [Aureobasidium melanogenum]
MPPKAARADLDIVYRSETPLRQKKFPNRRRTIRSSGVHTPAPLRQQSTLTQQPTWTVSRSPPTAEDEDEVEDEDQDYEEDELEKAGPRRKKRKSEADGKRQTTMTQYVPSSFIGERYDGASDLLLQFIPDDSFDGVRDSQSQLVLDSHDEGPQAGMQAFVDGNTSAAADGDVEMQRMEENHSQKTQSSSDHGDERVDSAFPKQQARSRPSPELPISAMNLKTPRRKFKSEIPSSNTPQSAIISICSTKSMRSPERSPLRNKSTNAFSQNHAAEDTRMSPVPESPTKPVSPFRLSPLRNRPTFRIPEKPPTLQHRSTIPDSEDTATQLTPFKQNKRNFLSTAILSMLEEHTTPRTIMTTTLIQSVVLWTVMPPASCKHNYNGIVSVMMPFTKREAFLKLKRTELNRLLNTSRMEAIGNPNWAPRSSLKSSVTICLPRLYGLSPLSKSSKTHLHNRHDRLLNSLHESPMNRLFPEQQESEEH